jgi:hypothetical protein
MTRKSERRPPERRILLLEKSCYTRFEDDYKDQIHDETARQSRWALGIGLIIFGF